MVGAIKYYIVNKPRNMMVFQCIV